MKSKNRDISIDLLRTLAIIFVLIIHTTSNFYVNSYSTSSFPIILTISSITCCAVPLFYMISGAFLINNKNTDYKSFYKKPLKIFFQTIFWTLIYLIIYKTYFHQDIELTKTIIKSFFTEQIGHLWYMYPLIGLYVLCPFISKLYYSLNNKEKKILILTVFIIPAILCTLQMKFWDLIQIPKFAIMFPEFGLFLLGKHLYEIKDDFQNKKKSILSFVGIVVGLASIVITALLHIKGNGISSSKPYFDANKVTVILLITSMFIFILSIKKYLEKLPNMFKKIITFIGSSTGGIYFIHMIFIQVWPNISILGVHFTQNTGSLLNMLSGAFVYLILSILSVLVIKNIPLLKKTIQ